MSGTATTIPIPTVPVFDNRTGQITQAWFRFFLALLERGGGPAGAAGGDLTGTYPDPTVAKIAGAPLASTAPTTGHLLIANGSAWDSKAMSGDATINSSGVITVTSGTPSGPAGGDLSGTYPNPTVARINGQLLGTTTATSGNLLIGDGSKWVSHGMTGNATINSGGTITVTGAPPTGTAGGDLSGTYPNPTVDQINGAVVPTSAPAVATNASEQLIAATTTGTGTTVALATNPTLAGATISVNNGLKLTSQTDDAGVALGTLTNAPTAGDPAFWLRIAINGTNYAVPAWTA